MTGLRVFVTRVLVGAAPRSPARPRQPTRLIAAAGLRGHTPITNTTNAFGRPARSNLAEDARRRFDHV